MKITLLILLAYITTPIIAQQNDAQYLLLRKEYTFSRDGSYEMTCNQKIKYLTYQSFHRYYGETFIVYNPQIQTLTINKSATTMADGKLITAPENSFNEVLPAWAARSGAYNHYKEMVVTHTGLEVGAVSELSYTIKTSKTPFNQIQIFEPFRFDIPADTLEFVFHVPNELEFRAKELKEQNNYETSETETGKTYTYRFTNVPAKELYKIVGPFAVPHITVAVGTKNMNALLLEIAPSVKEDGVVEKVMTIKDMSKVIDIQKEVLNIRTINTPIEYQLFPLQTPDIIQQQNSGTLFEKTILFQKLLKDNDIASEIVYEIPESFFSEEVGNISAITNMYVVVNIAGRPVAFSAVTESKINPIERQNAIFVKTTDNKLSSVETMGTQQINLHSDIQVSFDRKTKNVTVKRHEQLIQTGDGLAYIHPSDWQPSPVDIIGDKYAKIVKYTLENLKKQTFEIESETVVKDENNLLKLILNTPKNGIDAFGFTALPENMNSSVIMPLLISEEDTYSITLPPKAKIFVQNNEIEVLGTFGKMNLKMEVNKNIVTVKRQISFQASRILPKSYTEFAKMMKNWQAETFRAFYIQF